MATQATALWQALTTPIVHTCGGVLHEHRNVTMIILCSMLSIRSRGVSALMPCPGVGDLATASRRSVRCVFCCSNCSFSVWISAFRVSSSAFCLWTHGACDVSECLSSFATIACSHRQNMLCSNSEWDDRLMHIWLTCCQAAALIALFCQ